MHTICLRMIRNAWHFYNAFVSVFKVASVLRCSHFNSELLCSTGLTNGN